MRTELLKFDPKVALGAIFGSLIAVGGFVLATFALEGAGFPLDDAWIHQVYARNLVESGTWSFQAAGGSAGSTSPLWSLLQVPAHLFGIQSFWWSLGLGSLQLVFLSILAASWLFGRHDLRGVAAAGTAALFAVEWHLVWAALSGMETLAAGFLGLLVLYLLERSRPHALMIGVLTGVGLWLRPDMLSLVLPVGVVWFFRLRRETEPWSWLLRWLAGVLVLSLPYLGFQMMIGGRPWPTTLYAKQAEYAVLRGLPLLGRFLEQWRAPSAGALAILYPGLLIWLIQTAKDRDWARLAPLVWAVAYISAFAWRLPVTYQHGRYVMPVIPVLLVLGMRGLLDFLERNPDRGPRWVLRRSWVASLGVVAVLFLVLGSRAYAKDVAIIQTEMVRTSRWISEHTEEGALIAAHDIGALGFYGERPILDMAGLVSPEVIPILRNESALAKLLERHSADYLMTFPDWYPSLSSASELVYSSGGKHSPAAGGTNMSVFRP